MAEFTEKVIIQLKDEFSAAAQNITKNAFSMKEVFGALAGAFTVMKAFEFLKDSVHAFAENEKAVLELKGALQGLGIQSTLLVENYKNFAKQMEHTTFFTDEQVMASERLLTQFHIGGEEMKKTIQVAASLAQAYGMDLNSAVLTLIKTSEGNSMALRKMGIDLGDATLKTGDLGTIVDAVGKKFPNFAQAAHQGTAGALDRMSKNIEDIKKGFGGWLAEMDDKLGVSKFWSGVIEGKTDMFTGQTFPWIARQAKEATEAMSKMNDEAAKIAPKAPTRIFFTDETRKSYEDFMAELLISTADTYDKIDLERQKDFKKLGDTFTAEGLMSVKFLEGIDAANEKASREMTRAITKDVSDLGNNITTAVSSMGKSVSEGFKGMATSSLNIIGKATGKSGFGMAGQMVSSIMGVTSAMGSLMEAFEDDTRSQFQKLSDYIDEIDRQVADATRRARSYVDDIKGREGGERGTISGGGTESQDEISNIVGGKVNWHGNAKLAAGAASFKEFLEKASRKGLLVWRIDSDGNFIVIYNGSDIAIFIAYTKEWKVINRFIDDKITIATAKYVLYQAKKEGLNQSALGVPESDRPDSSNSSTSGGGGARSFSSTSSYSPAASSGVGGGGGSTVINVNTIDEKGVNEFLLDRLAPAMRQASGRDGVVLINERGISSNI